MDKRWPGHPREGTVRGHLALLHIPDRAAFHNTHTGGSCPPIWGVPLKGTTKSGDNRLTWGQLGFGQMSVVIGGGLGAGGDT